MARFALRPHPDFPNSAITAISATLNRDQQHLSLSYTVEGDLDAVLWPPPAASARTDALWMHTCFEAFVQPGGQAGYIELNLSPSGRWSSYAFEGYRVTMHDADVVPMLDWQKPTLTASADLSGMDQADWRLGLSAVIEERDGTKSYWALAHAPGQPDFHNRDCFTARLAAPPPA